MFRRLFYVALAAAALVALVLATGSMIGVSVPARATASEPLKVAAAGQRAPELRGLTNWLNSGPLTLAGLTWWMGYRWLAAPTVAAGFTTLELGALLGAAAGLTGWAVGRLLFIARRKRPGVLVVTAVILCALILLALPGWVRGGFLDRCKGVVKGEAVALPPWDPGQSAPLGATPESAPQVVCRVGGVRSRCASTDCASSLVEIEVVFLA